jgi:hypothetical protein
MPVKLLMDNKSVIALSRNPVHHDRSKHIDTKFHFIRECIEEGKIEVDYIGTRNSWLICSQRNSDEQGS